MDQCQYRRVDEISRRRWNRTGQSDRPWHLAVRLTRMGLRRQLRLGYRTATSCSVPAHWGSRCSIPPRCTGTGKSERILGEALGDERAEVAVASKIFPIAPFPASGQAARARQCAAVAAGAHSALPDPPAQPGGPRFGDHAGNARACSTAATSAQPVYRIIRLRDGRRPTPRSDGRSSATRCNSRLPTRKRSRIWSPSPSGRTAS